MPGALAPTMALIKISYLALEQQAMVLLKPSL